MSLISSASDAGFPSCFSSHIAIAFWRGVPFPAIFEYKFQIIIITQKIYLYHQIHKYKSKHPSIRLLFSFSSNLLFPNSLLPYLWWRFTLNLIAVIWCTQDHLIPKLYFHSFFVGQVKPTLLYTYLKLSYFHIFSISNFWNILYFIQMLKLWQIIFSFYLTIIPFA